MKLLANYLFAHWRSLSFLGAFVFFAMDMSGILGSWGYYIYYPMLLVLSYYCCKNNSKVSLVHIAYLIVCLMSILLNDIPSYYRIYTRYFVFILLLTSFSSLVNSRKIALMRLHLFHLFSILTVILVAVNYLFFSIGFVNDRAMQIYQDHGIFTGSTANNEMGLLGAVAIMFIVAFWGKFNKKLSLISKLGLLFCLFSAISMMAMASSRIGLMCTLISVIFVVYKLNSTNIGKLLFAMVIFVAAVFVTANVMGAKFRFMMQKNEGQLENINLNSREDMWKSRLREYHENPVFGIGFGYMKYGWGNLGAETTKGRIEAGSGWASVISQTGTMGAVCMALMVLPNLFFLLRHRSTSYCSAWYSGMCVMFILQPITEAYITTVGAVLCCLFWLNYSVIDSFRIGLLKEPDLDLSIYRNYKLFDKRLLFLTK